MNLRLPIAAAVVTAALAAASFRALHHDPGPAVATGLAPDPAAPGPAASTLPPLRRDRARLTVYVAGDVVHSGVYALAPGARGVDALKAAGGPGGDADLVAVNLAEPLTDGEELVVPVRGAEAPAGGERDGGYASAASSGGHAKRHGRRHRKRRARAAPTLGDANAEPPTSVVDLNSAGESELETLPGIGASLASRIVTFREVNGPFTSPEDLLDVGGMTEARLNAIQPYVTTR